MGEQLCRKEQQAVARGGGGGVRILRIFFMKLKLELEEPCTFNCAGPDGMHGGMYECSALFFQGVSFRLAFAVFVFSQS